MKTYLLVLFLLNSALGFSQTHVHHTNKKETKQISEKLSNDDAHSLILLLKTNDELFNSLLKNDQGTVETNARNLEAALKKVIGKPFSSLREKSTYLQSISKANTKEKNLSYYSEFIPVLVDIVKKYHPDSNFQIFYCPMVKKSWIQDERVNSSVKNVFAQEMLECGGKEN